MRRLVWFCTPPKNTGVACILLITQKILCRFHKHLYFIFINRLFLVVILFYFLSSSHSLFTTRLKHRTHKVMHVFVINRIYLVLFLLLLFTLLHWPLFSRWSSKTHTHTPKYICTLSGSMGTHKMLWDESEWTRRTKQKWNTENQKWSLPFPVIVIATTKIQHKHTPQPRCTTVTVWSQKSTEIHSANLPPNHQPTIAAAAEATPAATTTAATEKNPQQFQLEVHWQFLVVVVWPGAADGL